MYWRQKKDSFVLICSFVRSAVASITLHVLYILVVLVCLFSFDILLFFLSISFVWFGFVSFRLIDLSCTHDYWLHWHVIVLCFWVRSVYPPMGIVSHVTNFNQQNWTSFSLWCPLVIIGKHTSECANEWGALLNFTRGLLFLCFSLSSCCSLYFFRILFLLFLILLFYFGSVVKSTRWREPRVAWAMNIGFRYRLADCVRYFGWWLREEKMSPRHCQRGWRRRQHGRR